MPLRLEKLICVFVFQDIVDELTHAGFVEGLKVTAETAYMALQRCVASSLKVLQPESRLSLAQLSIFPSKFDAAAAAAVLGVDERVAKRQLRHLQERSLVIAANTTQTGQGQPPHYELHLFMRDMALSGYEQDDQYLHSQSRFVEHFVAMLRAHKHRHTPEGIISMHQLALQRHNLVKLFALLATQQQPLSAELLAACCQLGQPGLGAIWLLRLDLTVVWSALETLLKWARSCSLLDSIIDAQAQLGYMLGYDPKQVERADKESQAALEAARQRYGQDDPHLVLPLMALGDIMNDKVNAAMLDEYIGCKKGRRYYEQAHRILVRTSGESHPETLSCAMGSFTFMHSSQQVIKALRQLLDTAQVELQPEHPAVVNIRSTLGEALSGANNSQLVESIPLLREHLDHCMKQLGYNERLIPEAMLALGNALVYSKQPSQQQEGLQLIQQAIAVFCELYGDNSEDVIIAQQEVLAPAFVKLKQTAAAIQLLKDSLQRCEIKCGETSRIVQIGLQNLADAYTTQGDYLAAARELARAHAKIRKCAVSDVGGLSEEMYVAKTGVLCDIAINLQLQGRWVFSLLLADHLEQVVNHLHCPYMLVLSLAMISDVGRAILCTTSCKECDLSCNIFRQCI